MAELERNNPNILNSKKTYATMKEIYGTLVFSRSEMKQCLPKDVFAHLSEVIEGKSTLSPAEADIIALAMKEWAISKGADHFAHWFHPMTELTAEKHTAFLNSTSGNPINVFSGKDLTYSEPDASSFPSGGTRSTFESRGNSYWDPSSPAFIIKSKKGGTMCIPSVFKSYSGTPLDLKSYLIRSTDAVESRALRLLKLFGNRGVKKVYATLGGEQEFFVLDREKAQQRPDIRYCGRTLLGCPPPCDQKMESHYLGSIPMRVLSYMEDVQRDLSRLGVDVATRHNEAARCQFEFAPLYSLANLACDQNQIIMETMRKMAAPHNLRLLFGEKPFDGLNGSGKHVNFSLTDNEGRNLLKPSSNYRKNIVFLSFLSAFLLGASRYYKLLLASVATAGNLYRLGGDEAPPFIPSIFLGSVVTSMLDNVEKSSLNISPANTLSDLGDRNRTSPLAFTGDKFEFRAPGASQSMAVPAMAVFAIWAAGLDEFIDMYRVELKKKSVDPMKAATRAIKKSHEIYKNILFEGDAYSKEWQAEAVRRGLADVTSIPQGLKCFKDEKIVNMLTKIGVCDAVEADIFAQTRTEMFVKSIEIEMAVLREMLWEGIIPSIGKQLSAYANEHELLKKFATEKCDNNLKVLTILANSRLSLMGLAQKLDNLKLKAANLPLYEHADFLFKKSVPLMAEIRKIADEVEVYISKENLVYPNYRELLSLA
ncbi:MAG: glutamine synthetase III [Synergistaceae bacterium]|nr:glutamine synthetase III [Synergistaceae bacterium]